MSTSRSRRWFQGQFAPARKPKRGKYGPGHVCKHGVRFPDPCQPCDDDAREAHEANRS